MNYVRIFFLVVLPGLASAFLNYDRAILAGQKNNWPASAELLKKELAANPESAQLLYDTGVSSYKSGDYDYALSYFLKASETPTASAALQEQALFNAGNTHVALKQLENALETFQKVLDKNPKNAKAAHNKDIVKKMLEEQKQQQQNQNNDKNKNEKQDKKEQNNQNDQKENNEQNKKDINKDQQQENNDKTNEQKKNDAQEKEKKEQEQKSEQEKQSQQNKQNSDQQTKDEQQSQSHATPKEEQPNPEQQLTPNMMRMLDEREKKDAQLNKQLMRAMAGAQNAGADHNEHYW